MSKPVDFGVLKQKIIKTDEIFKLFYAKDKECAKLKTLVNATKGKLDAAAGELKLAKAANFGLREKTAASASSPSAALQAKLDRLQRRYDSLERLTSARIGALEVECQTAREELARARVERGQAAQEARRRCPLEEGLRRADEQRAGQLEADLEALRRANGALQSQNGELGRLQAELDALRRKSAICTEENGALQLQVSKLAASDVRQKNELVALCASKTELLERNKLQNDKLKRFQAEFEALQHKNACSVEKISLLQLQIDNLTTSDVRQINETLEGELKQKSSSLQLQVSTLPTSDICQQNKLVALCANKTQLSNENKLQSDEFKCLQAEFEALKQKNALNLEENRLLQLQVSTLTLSDVYQKNELLTLRANKTELLEENKPRSGELARLQAEFATLKQQNALYLEKNKSLELQVSTLTACDVRQKTELLALRASKTELLDDNKPKNGELKRMQAECEKLKQKNARTIEKNGALQLQVSNLTTSDARHQNELFALRASKIELLDANDQLKQIIEQQKIELRESNQTPTDLQIEQIMNEHQHVPFLLTPIAQSPIMHSIDFTERLKRRTIQKRQIKRKLPKRKCEIDLLGALVALKAAKINFTLSNEPLVAPPVDFSSKLVDAVRKRSKKRRHSKVEGNVHVLSVKEEPVSRSCDLMAINELSNAVSGEVARELHFSQNVNCDRLAEVGEGTEVGNLSRSFQLEDEIRPLALRKDDAKKVGLRKRLGGTNLRQKLLRSIRGGRVAASNRVGCVLPVVGTVGGARAVGTVAGKGGAGAGVVIEARKVKSPKVSYKRPICRMRQSARLLARSPRKGALEEGEEGGLQSPPGSPEPCLVGEGEPVIIPLEKFGEGGGKMATTRINLLFSLLVNYTNYGEIVDEIVGEFLGQDSMYIASAILKTIIQDTTEKPTLHSSNFAVLTSTQCTMLGFMSKLDKQGKSTFAHFIDLAEAYILSCRQHAEIDPLARTYAAICKHLNAIHRVRRFCCDVFYHCGDMAAPFLYAILPSWTELLPRAMRADDLPIARVLVQIVLLKSCNEPGYRLRQLKDMLSKFYLYPIERWSSEELFKEFFAKYLKNPVKSNDLPILLLCKNMPEKWVVERLEADLKPVLDKITTENFKATVIILIGNILSALSAKSTPNHIPAIKEWLHGLVTDGTPDIIARSVQYSINKLKA